jgi:leucyl-tRNA synthetase
MDPHNKDEFASQKNLEYWGGVDLYTGGTEHVTRHMLYASFWHNFLYDCGFVPNRMPFKRRMCNGLILDEKGKKMGKSSGNAVDPIEIIDLYGADAFRIHILFMGDYEQNTVWSLKGMNGAVNFLKRIYSLRNIVKDASGMRGNHEKELLRIIKRTDKGIISDEDGKSYDERADFKFNTVIAGFMEFLNLVKKDGFITKEELRRYLIIMNPFIPHITSELYEEIFGGNIMDEKFPDYDETALSEETVEIPVQLSGKLKGTITVLKDEPQESVTKKALELLGVAEPKKIVYVKNKIINVVV